MEGQGILRLKLALSCIDRHPEEYEEKREQDKMLGDLIRQHSLTEMVVRRQGRFERKLTVEAYRNSLGNVSSTHKNASKHKERYWIQALFMRGSVILDAEWLAKIGYKAPEPTEDDESDQEEIQIKRTVRRRSKAKSEDEYAPEEVAQAAAIDDSDDAAAAALEATSPATSEMSTVPEEIEEPMAGPARGKPKFERNDQSGVSEGLKQSKDASTKPVTQPDGPQQKRKSNPNEANLPPPKRRLTTPQEISGIAPTTQLRSNEDQDGSRRPRVGVQVLQGTAGPKLTKKRKLGEEETDPRKKSKASQDMDNREPEASTASGNSRLGETDESTMIGTVRPAQRIQSEAQKPQASRLGARGNPTRGLLRLGDDDVIDTFDGIWLWVQNFSRNLFEAMRIDNDDGPAPSFELYPELHELYRILFGDNWQKQAAVLSHTDSISALQLVEAVLSAGMYKAVWQTNAPWKEANDYMDAIAEVEEYINRIQQQFSREHRIHTIMWHAITNRARDEGFQKTTMQPYAEDIADKIMLTLSRLLNGLKTKNVEQSFWPKAKQRVVRMLMQALTLKGKIKAAPNYYQWTWPKSGERVDDERMEHIRQGEGEQEVLWAVTPIIERRDTKDDPWVLSSRAKVWCRPPMTR